MASPRRRSCNSSGAKMSALPLLLHLALFWTTGVHAAAARIDIHRQKSCAYATLWDVNFKEIASVEALEADTQQAQQWVRAERTGGCAAAEGEEPCWRKENVQIVDGKLELKMGSRIDTTADGRARRSAASMRVEKHIRGGWSGVNRVRIFAKFPQVLIQ